MHPTGAIFDAAVQVSVTADEDATVRCSTDGSIPTTHHDRYQGPLTIAATTVLRCRTFKSGHQPSPTTTQTYLVNIPAKLPILALTVHPANLWNRYTGIYEHFEEKGGQWERDAHVEYFPRSAEPTLAMEGRIRIHGGYSRSRPKKSFRFYYEPLPAQLQAPDNIFTWQTPAKERAVIFSAAESEVHRDELLQSLLAAAGGMTSAKMPVFLYLNGEPWGIYYVRERIDEEYLQRRVGPGQYDLLVSEPGRPRVMNGDRKHWQEMVSFLESNDFADPAVFATAAAEFVDIDNFTDYWLYNLYAANMDWPHHNMSMFAPRRGADRRWRWICWDADATFDFGRQGLNHDTFAFATRSSVRHDLRYNFQLGRMDSEEMVVTTLLARKLLENADYRARVERRMSELLETDLHPQRVEQALDRIHAEVAADLPLDWKRWDPQGDGSAQERAYYEDAERVRRFIHERPAIVRGRFQSPPSSGGAPTVAK
jgi:hypothetical protein